MKITYRDMLDFYKQTRAGSTTSHASGGSSGGSSSSQSASSQSGFTNQNSGSTNTSGSSSQGNIGSNSSEDSGKGVKVLLLVIFVAGVSFLVYQVVKLYDKQKENDSKFRN